MNCLPDRQARMSGETHRLASIVSARRRISLKELMDEIILAAPEIVSEAAREKESAADRPVSAAK